MHDVCNVGGETQVVQGLRTGETARSSPKGGSLFSYSRWRACGRLEQVWVNEPLAMYTFRARS